MTKSSQNCLHNFRWGTFFSRIKPLDCNVGSLGLILEDHFGQKKAVICIIVVILLVLVAYYGFSGFHSIKRNQSATQIKSTKKNFGKSDSKSKITGRNQTALTSVSINIDGRNFSAHLNNSSASRQLIAMLPYTVRVQGLNSGLEEHTADLKKPLSTSGMPAGAKPRPNDIGYWSPQPRIVLYWGEVGFYDGIHILGSFDNDNAKNYIKSLTKAYEITITRK
ncbi:cyclophilin-like fold protein [Leuconostoc falkenbergense]|uniref:cyclophilin-like fold protein n=1 Tax=Leuconostoc falkenbergense TaxID=2766470 RepID=UPI0024AE4585|nr:cyclophilin-like fold protein [Leuconostoc falkenbergense]MDI6666714.1 cyclophilin-like fold protein [Leuconostoc falkenbergense]